jgi:hypothetical protein
VPADALDPSGGGRYSARMHVLTAAMRISARRRTAEAASVRDRE